MNLYHFIKATAQKTYSCIFDFDTYHRKIYVRSAADSPRTAPVYISLNNLAKEIKVDEDTENIFTRLDVSGADGVNIRSVNPMGSNKIYNLDYFMATSHFDHRMVERWEAWKANFASHQMLYHNTSIEVALKLSAILTEGAALTVLSGKDLTILESQQAVYIQYLASLIDRSAGEYRHYQQLLNEVNTAIAAKKNEITAQQAVISELESQRDALMTQLAAIRSSVAFSNFFSEEEMLVLDRYFKEDSMQDSAFVLSNVDAYVGAGESSVVANMTMAFSGGTVKKIPGAAGKDLFSVKSGTLSYAENSNALNAEVISASLECNTETGQFVLSALLGSGTLNGMRYRGGCISMTGICGAVTHNTAPDGMDLGVWAGTALSIEIMSAKLFFTKDTTEYERHAVEWELFEYGQECLSKLAYPSFRFDVSVANFFALEDFISFAKSLELGQKIYLALSEDKVLCPILIGVEVDYENLSSMKLRFGDKYTFSDAAFELVDLLEQSVSMGKTVDVSKLNYNAFIESGAATAVKEFMDSALDVSKNAILSGENMAISWDASGMRFRRNAAFGGFEPEQLGIINNSIVFTDDGWASAKMAIGKFQDKNTGDTWGVVAPNLVGTLLAGSNLVIESAKQDGGVAVFRVDADGAKLFNASFDIVAANTQITMNPYSGFAIGSYPLYGGDGHTIDTDMAKFWVDPDGNVHLKGTLEGVDGKFTGTVQAADFLDKNGKSVMDAAKGKIMSDYLELKGLAIKNNAGQTTFSIDSNGHVTASGTFHMGAGSSISWESVTNKPSIPTVPGYIKSTYIDSTRIESPEIRGGKIIGGSIESESTIDVTTDLRVGNNVYIGKFGDQLVPKSLYFTQTANITSYDDSLSISAQTLSLRNIGYIDWGYNAPVAVFG